MNRKGGFHPYACTTIVFWSLAYVLTRMASSFFSPLSLGFLRYGIASAVLLCFAAVLRVKPPQRKDVPWFILTGFVGFFIYIILFNIGASYVTAATGSVIIAIVPVLTALMASFVFGEKLKGYQWAAIGVEFAGILVLTLYDGVFTANQGVVWMLAAAVCLSSYNLLQRRLTRTYTALQTTTYSILFGTVMLAVFAPIAAKELHSATAAGIGYLLCLGIFSSAVAYATWSKAMEMAQRTSSVSNYMFFTPFLTSLLGFLMLGELPSKATFAGGVMIIGGALWFNRENLFPKRKSTEEPLS